MPLQNRVTPWNDIIAVPARGLFMGNRGNLHDRHRRLKSSRWTRQAWITCVLEFKQRHRTLMTPGSYTELFFLDEATAFAAGHRPCAECRRADYNEFKRLWLQENGHSLAGRAPTAASMDAVMHDERVTADGAQRRWQARLDALPDGAMVALHAHDAAWLVRGGGLRQWRPDGYAGGAVAAPRDVVQVITPPSLVRVLAAGYRPVVHRSA